MHLVINHLTRMQAPRICIAGIEPDTGRHVHPITARRDPLTRELLCGMFKLGVLLELGELRSDSKRPEIEDHIFRCSDAAILGMLSPNRYMELLRQHARTSLTAIFGTDLLRHDWSHAVETDTGEASLGILRPRRRPDLILDRYGKLRLRLNDEDRPAFLPVTDVRFVEDDHKTIKTDLVSDVGTRLRAGVEVILMLGLARAFQAPGDDRERHWLQVNGICMADRPLGEMP